MEEVKKNANIVSCETTSRPQRIQAVVSSMSIIFLLKDIMKVLDPVSVNTLFSSLSLEEIHLSKTEDSFMETFKSEFPDNTATYVLFPSHVLSTTFSQMYYRKIPVISPPVISPPDISPPNFKQKYPPGYKPPGYKPPVISPSGYKPLRLRHKRPHQD